jgi:hypothetical protein
VSPKLGDQSAARTWHQWNPACCHSCKWSYHMWI